MLIEGQVNSFRIYEIKRGTREISVGITPGLFIPAKDEFFLRDSRARVYVQTLYFSFHTRRTKLFMIIRILKNKRAREISAQKEKYPFACRQAVFQSS